jgi:adenine-specific DNA-methyltransferase
VAIMFEPKTFNYKSENLPKTSTYPRLRYMGSKYKIVPYLTSILSEIPFETALDAFSGSGVVSYALKELGKKVTSNDFLQFSSTIAKAIIENPGVTVGKKDLELLLSPNKDGRNFIQKKFEGLYFPQTDHEFLDRIWSHLDDMSVYKRELAIAACCLAAARKQPRGVFTITDLRYDDGRRAMHTPLETLFHEAIIEYNNAVFDNGKKNKSICSDVFNIDPKGYDLVYFDPPYAPPKDDADYVKRYHFLEGLSVYWEDLKIMEQTKSKKIEKKYTPFAYKNSIREALRALFNRFSKSTIVLSYSSNSIPNEKEIYDLLKEVKSDVEVYSVPHKYSFGTHVAAVRKEVNEYIFVARGRK